MTLRRIMLSWVVMGSALCAPDVLACTCERPSINPNPIEAPHIFLGQVTTIEDYVTSSATGQVNLRKVCLVPEYVVWGPAGSSDQGFCVVTGMGGGDCGIPFEPGESYLVYAGPSPDDAPDAGLPYTGLCWGTSKVRRVKTTLGRTVILPSVGSFLAGVGISAALFLLLRRRAARSPS